MVLLKKGKPCSNGSVITDRKGNKITARDTICEIATSTRSGLMSSDDYNKIRDNSANIAHSPIHNVQKSSDGKHLHGM